MICFILIFTYVILHAFSHPKNVEDLKTPFSGEQMNPAANNKMSFELHRKSFMFLITAFMKVGFIAGWLQETFSFSKVDQLKPDCSFSHYFLAHSSTRCCYYSVVIMCYPWNSANWNKNNKILDHLNEGETCKQTVWIHYFIILGSNERMKCDFL